METLLPILTAAVAETWQTPEYFWDNRNRTDPETCVIQRTLRGESFWRAGDREQRVGVGFAMIYTHDEASSYGYPPDATEPYEEQFLAFIPGCLRPFFDALRERFGSLLRLPGNGEASRLFEQALRLHADRAFSDLMEFGALLYALLCALWREQFDLTKDRDPIAYGHFLLHNDAHGRLRIKELAQRLGISREHFVRRYTARYGISPGREHRRLKLERARSMLGVSSSPLDDIAAACGFGGADAFRRSFYAHFGTTPGQFRRNPRTV